MKHRNLAPLALGLISLFAARAPEPAATLYGALILLVGWHLEL